MDGSARIDKLDAYVPQSGAQRLRNIKTHLINTSYVPQFFDLAKEHKSLCSLGI
jgi:hypothetical protein